MPGEAVRPRGDDGFVDRARADEIAQAWIDASPGEQAALNRFAVLEDALVALAPDGEVEWTVESVTGRPTVLLLAEGGLLTLAIEGGERSGAPAAEVQSRFARAEGSIQAVELVERTEGRTRHRRWRFHRAGAPSLELSTTKPVGGHFGRAEGERTERFALALAAAAGWAVPADAEARRPGT